MKSINIRMNKYIEIHGIKFYTGDKALLYDDKEITFLEIYDNNLCKYLHENDILHSTNGPWSQLIKI